MRGGAVDSDDAAPAPAGDDIGLDPRAVGNVDDRDLLAFEQIRCVHQIGVDGDRSHIIEISLSDRCPMDLRLHHDPHHGIQLLQAPGAQPAGGVCY